MRGLAVDAALTATVTGASMANLTPLSVPFPIIPAPVDTVTFMPEPADTFKSDGLATILPLFDDAILVSNAVNASPE